ncbi:MAG: hypothetical protein K0R39_3181 [Symbiobacteriaceae bacterium]|jgi:uncharacterized protein YukE|nr:hypothetical protein [Symbiobacteriaceae bacterium]
MERILVNPDDLQELARDLRQYGEELHEVGGRIQSAVYRMSWETRSRANVNSRTDEARNQAQRLAERFDTLARYLERKAEAFEQADRPTADNGPFDIAQIVRQIQELLPPWARMLGITPESLATWVTLGTFAFGPAADLGNKWLMTGTQAIERYLREGVYPPMLGLVPGIPATAAFIKLGALLHKGFSAEDGMALGIDGLTAGKAKVDVSGMGVEASVDIVNYEKELIDGVTVEAAVGHLAAEVDTFDMDELLTEGKADFGVSAEASTVHGELDVDLLGNEKLGLGVGAEGDVLGAEGAIKIGTSGVEVGGYAYTAQGEASVDFKFFDWSIKLGVRGCAGCVGGGFKADWAGGSGELGLAAIFGGRVFWDID